MEIAVISGKGGTGKSSISAAMATLEERVLIADCDVDAANLYLLFNPDIDEEQVYIGGQSAVIDYNICDHCGICMEYCRFDAITSDNGHVTVSEVLCDGCHLCRRVCPREAIAMIDNDKSRMYSGAFRNGMMVYGRLAPGEENSGKLVNLVRQRARELSKIHNLENIIIDGPPGIGCAAISSLTGTDRVVIVTEPSLSGIKDLKRAAELVLKFGIRCYVVINKYDLNTGLSDLIMSWCEDAGIEAAGKIPFDPKVPEAMVNCRTITEWAPESEVSRAIMQIRKRISE